MPYVQVTIHSATFKASDPIPADQPRSVRVYVITLTDRSPYVVADLVCILLDRRWKMIN